MQKAGDMVTLPVLVSGKGDSQLFIIVKISSAIREAQVAAVFGTIIDWRIVDNIHKI